MEAQDHKGPVTPADYPITVTHEHGVTEHYDAGGWLRMTTVPLLELEANGKRAVHTYPAAQDRPDMVKLSVSPGPSITLSRAVLLDLLAKTA